jgi:hypothetical protein
MVGRHEAGRKQTQTSVKRKTPFTAEAAKE